MKTITIPGFIYASKPDKYDFANASCVDGVKYSFIVYDFPDNNETYTKVCPFELSFDWPESFNPVAGFVTNLQAEKKKERADFQARITEINRQISQLQAIEFTPKEVS